MSRRPLTEVEAGLIEHWNLLRWWAWKLTGNRALAEDLVSQTAVRALEKQHLFSGQGHLKAWLFLMMRRIRLNDPAVRTGRVEAVMADLDLVQGAMEGAQEATVALGELPKFLACLPSDYSDLLLLCRVGGMSYDEAAEHFGLTRGTVRSRLARATATIRAMHEGNGIPNDPFLVLRGAFRRLESVEAELTDACA